MKTRVLFTVVHNGSDSGACTIRPTYEKPWPCAVILGWFFREAFKPHGLFRQDVYAFCSVFHFISILMVGLNAALTYSRAWRIQ